MKHAHYTTVVASCFLGFWLPLMVALSLGTITQSNKAVKVIRTLIPLCCIVFIITCAVHQSTSYT